MRVVPDLVFDAGAFCLIAFLARAIAIDLKLRRAERTEAGAEVRTTERRAA
jgi:hypothetical protein